MIGSMEVIYCLVPFVQGSIYGYRMRFLGIFRCHVRYHNVY